MSVFPMVSILIVEETSGILGDFWTFGTLSYSFLTHWSLEDILESLAVFTFHLITVHSKESVKAAFVVAMVIVDG